MTKMATRSPIVADIREIFNAPDRDKAGHLLNRFLTQQDKPAPQVVAWAEEADPEGFTVCS